MKERLVTFACAIGALLLAILIFSGSDAGFDTRREAARPTTQERRANGYYAAMSWLEAEGIRVISLRDRFTELRERDDLAPAGNLLVVTLPATTGFQTEEFLPLDRWIRAGNSLLVVAALSDNPDWAVRHAGLTPGDLNLLTGIEYETTRSRTLRLSQARDPRRARSEPVSEQQSPAAETFRQFAEPERSAFVPNRDHVFFTGVDEVIALSDFPRQTWTLKVPYEGFVLALAHERESDEGVFWTRPLGSGRIIVSGYGSVFTNRALGLGDNARLLANIVAATLGAEGTVLFDDGHQGLGMAYDPQRFYSDPRLHVTLAILIGLWLVWVLGSTRLRVPVQQSPVPREADLVRTAGSFLSRVLSNPAAALRLFEHFFRQSLAHAPDRSSAPDPWDYLLHHPRIAAGDIRQLRTWHAAARAGRRVPLRKLHNLMVRIHGQLA